MDFGVAESKYHILYSVRVLLDLAHQGHTEWNGWEPVSRQPKYIKKCTRFLIFYSMIFRLKHVTKVFNSLLNYHVTLNIMSLLHCNTTVLR